MDFNNNKIPNLTIKMLSNEEQTYQNNGKFKLHIDSKLIRSDSSALPDELKDLGVCAYDERAFEKDLLDQIDFQIAEYQSNNKTIGESESDDDDEAEVIFDKTPSKRKLSVDDDSGKKQKNYL